MTEPELELVDGWVERELAEEFPELRLLHTRLDVRPTRSPPEVRKRLRMLADRYTGGKVVHMRQDPVPWAYRVFSRQVGIDPDHDRTPVEAVALRRLKQGGLHSENIVDDALTIAIAETGVPLIALDADRVAPEQLGLRLARAGETLDGTRLLSERQLVVADADRPVAVVLGEVSRDAGVTRETERMAVCSLGVKGVPRISLEEALWSVAETLYTDASA
jgi:DNA/RNA-binding domain of Phe-tRNA-synthetase-like protein